VAAPPQKFEVVFQGLGVFVTREYTINLHKHLSWMVYIRLFHKYGELFVPFLLFIYLLKYLLCSTLEAREISKGVM
jgi:hypothetical protein